MKEVVKATVERTTKKRGGKRREGRKGDNKGLETCSLGRNRRPLKPV